MNTKITGYNCLLHLSTLSHTSIIDSITEMTSNLHISTQKTAFNEKKRNDAYIFASLTVCKSEKTKLSSQVKLLCQIAQSAIQTSDIAFAQSLLMTAKEAALLIEKNHIKSSLLENIAKAQVQTGDKVAATETALLAVRHHDKVSILIQIARMQLHDTAFAKETLTGAKTIALYMIPEENRSPFVQEIAELHAQIGYLSVARTIAVRIPCLQHRSSALRNIAYTCFKIHYTYTALRTLQKAEKTALSIACPSARSSALRNIAYTCIEIGNIYAARQFLEKAKKEALSIQCLFERSSKLQKIAKVQIEANIILDGSLTLEESARVILDIYSTKCRSLISEATSQEALESEAASQESIGSEITSQELVVLDTQELLISETASQELEDIVQAQIKINDITRAEASALAIKNPHYRSSALRKIVQAKLYSITKAKKAPLATEISRYKLLTPQNAGFICDLIKARATALLIESFYDRSLALRKIAQSEMQLGYIDNAKRTLKEAQTIALDTKPLAHQIGVLQKIALTQSQCGDTNGMEYTISIIEDNHSIATTYRKIAKIQMHRGTVIDVQRSLKKSEQAAHLIENVYRKSLEFYKIAKIQIELRDSSQAEKNLRVALDNAYQIKDFGDQSKVLQTIAQGFIQIKKEFVAEEILYMAKKVSLNINIPCFRSLDLHDIAQVFIKMNNIIAAQQITPFIEDLNQRSLVLHKIAKIQIKQGELDLAQQTIFLIPSLEQKIASILAIARTFV